MLLEVESEESIPMTPRAKCLVKDVIDLKNNNWNKKNVHIVEGPRRLKDIHDSFQEDVKKAEAHQRDQREFYQNNRGYGGKPRLEHQETFPCATLCVPEYTRV
eukprot:GHVR01041617.1.p2 GENE.GHVR01041617.1~~GHVR01041617.1.p2  ORF type:complete len:103 (+),score=15.17 GHVR01041617.1:2-310(+)